MMKNQSKLEKYQDMQAMVQKEINAQFPKLFKQYATQFGVNKTPTHTHNGTDSVQIAEVNLVRNIKYIAGGLGSIEDETFYIRGLQNINRLDFNGYIVNGLTDITFTGSLSAGATSGTLSSSWSQTTGAYVAVMANGDVVSMTLTNGNTSATWTPALSSSSAGNAQVLGESNTRAIFSGIALFGKGFLIQTGENASVIDVSTSRTPGQSIIQTYMYTYFEGSDIQNGVGSGYIAYATDLSGTPVATLAVDSYDGKALKLTTTFEPGWYLIGSVAIM